MGWCTANVCFWPKVDIGLCPFGSGYQGEVLRLLVTSAPGSHSAPVAASRPPWRLSVGRFGDMGGDPWPCAHFELLALRSPSWLRCARPARAVPLGINWRSPTRATQPLPARWAERRNFRGSRPAWSWTRFSHSANRSISGRCRRCPARIPSSFRSDPCADPTSCQLNFSFAGKAARLTPLHFWRPQTRWCRARRPCRCNFLTRPAPGIPTRSA